MSCREREQVIQTQVAESFGDKQGKPKFFLGYKITADGDCSHEIKRHLLLGRKVMTNLDSILKSKDLTLATEVRLVKAMVFPVVMYRRESWTIKKAKHRRIDAFELWCWRRLLRVPWNARRSNQSFLKEIGPLSCQDKAIFLLILNSFIWLLLIQTICSYGSSDAFIVHF